MTAPRNAALLRWPPLVPGVLIKRYKRFLADVALEDHRIVTAHCPNSGSMKGCCEPNRPVYLSRQDSPSRKLKFTWELIRMPSSLVGVNTLVPNRLVFGAVKANAIRQLSGYGEIKREVSTGRGSRIDLMLSNNDTDRCYVEVKNCTMVEAGTACFPDAVTARGLKHLGELQHLVASGYRAAMFFLIQRTDAEAFTPADHIDPAYGRGLREAAGNGVEILVYDVAIDLSAIRINREIPYFL